MTSGDHLVFLSVDDKEGSVEGANAIEVWEAVSGEEREGEIEGGGECGFEWRDQDESGRFCL